MNCASQTLKVIENAFSSICSYFPANSESAIMTDVILQVNGETGSLTIYDDDDNEIFSDIVDEWVGNDSDEFYSSVETLLRDYIHQHSESLKELSIIKPYSFMLVDDEKETISELYLVDDDAIVIDTSSLMKNLDKDLDDFFDRLMKE